MAKTAQEIAAQIKALTKDPVEWDSLLLARRLQPILEELANGSGGGSAVIVPDWPDWGDSKWEEGVYFDTLEEAGLAGLYPGTIAIHIPVHGPYTTSYTIYTLDSVETEDDFFYYSFRNGPNNLYIEKSADTEGKIKVLYVSGIA